MGRWLGEWVLASTTGRETQGGAWGDRRRPEDTVPLRGAVLEAENVVGVGAAVGSCEPVSAACLQAAHISLQPEMVDGAAAPAAESSAPESGDASKGPGGDAGSGRVGVSEAQLKDVFSKSEKVRGRCKDHSNDCT